MSERTISIRYIEAVDSFVELGRSLSDEEWATRVPCTPIWTARDVLSHVAGVPDDGLAGRVDGVATEPWTASQVERNAGFTVDELLDRMLGQHELFGTAIEQLGEERPPYDCHTHEHDIRQAIGRPGNRESAIIEDAMLLLTQWIELPLELTIRFSDGAIQVVGTPGAERQVELATSPFEVFRSRLGRRTQAQVRGLNWTGASSDIDTIVASWFNFGPSDITIVE
jgi:hypothetical protein